MNHKIIENMNMDLHYCDAMGLNVNIYRRSDCSSRYSYTMFLLFRFRIIDTLKKK